jgi:hypothetical protein
MLNKSYGHSANVEAERARRLAREAEHKRNMMLGIFIAPAFMLGWFPLVWIIAKFFK